MRGLPSSGKTTLVNKNLKGEWHGRAVCSSDFFFYERSVSGESYDFDPTLLPEAHKKCRDDFRQAISNKLDVIVDNTNLTAGEIAWYYTEAEDAGYEVLIYNVDCKFSECVAREEKGIDLDTLHRMARVLHSEVLPPWWRVRNA